MPISRLNERNAHGETACPRAARSIRNRAQFKARKTRFERLGILFQEKEVNSEVTPLKYKTGEMSCVARV